MKTTTHFSYTHAYTCDVVKHYFYFQIKIKINKKWPYPVPSFAELGVEDIAFGFVVCYIIILCVICYILYYSNVKDTTNCISSNDLTC